MEFNISKFKERIVGVLKGRRETFKKIGEEKPIGEAGVIVLTFLSIEIIMGLSIKLFLPLLTSFIVWISLALFVFFCMVHLFVGLSNYLRNFTKTFCTLAFAMIPEGISILLLEIAALLFIPFFSPLSENISVVGALVLMVVLPFLFWLFGSIYGVIIMVISLNVVYDISKLRSTIIILLAHGISLLFLVTSYNVLIL